MGGVLKGLGGAAMLAAVWMAQLCAAGEGEPVVIPPDVAAEVEASYKEQAPAAVSGVVYLDANANGKRDADEKGLPRVGVTDGVSIIDTDDSGAYTIEIKPDATTPWTPARTVSVLWPENHWPVGRYWRRLSEIPGGKDVDFGLRPDKQALPFAFVQVTDNHGGGGAYRGYAEELKRLNGMAKFIVDTGDMLYANYSQGGASIMAFRGLAANVERAQFGIPFFAVPGNHDFTDGTTNKDPKHPLFGNGVYTKFIGPVRWSFDYAGSHFVGLDWKKASGDPAVLWEDVTPQETVDWFKKDLARVPAERRVFVFVHFPTGVPEFHQVIGRATYTFGGHNHRVAQYNYGGPSITALNLNGQGSGNIGIVTEKDFAIVNRCAGCKSAHNYHSKHCGLGYPVKGAYNAALGPVRGQPMPAPAGELGSKTVDGGGKGIEFEVAIDVGSAKRCGFKIGNAEVAFDGETLHVAGVPVPFKPWPEQKNKLSLRVAASSNMLILYANDLIRTHKPTAIGDAGKVTFFAEGGAATLTEGTVRPLGEGVEQVLANLGYDR